jgi:hypothetical protein
MDEIEILRKMLKKYKVEEGKRVAPRKYVLPVSLIKAHKYVARILKGGATITAIKIETEIEEVEDLKEAEEKGAKEAVTTPVPKRGCPMPIWDPLKEAEARATAVLERFLNPEPIWDPLKEAEARATAVLERFLNPDQLEDFKQKKAFVVRGGETGKHYMVCHRYSRRASKYGIVYDMRKKCRVCVEPTDLPAPEEMLALLVVLSCERTEKSWRNSLYGN